MIECWLSCLVVSLDIMLLYLSSKLFSLSSTFFEKRLLVVGHSHSQRIEHLSQLHSGVFRFSERRLSVFLSQFFLYDVFTSSFVSPARAHTPPCGAPRPRDTLRRAAPPCAAPHSACRATAPGRQPSSRHLFWTGRHAKPRASTQDSIF